MDYISRQEAIEALREAENHAFNNYYKALVKAHTIIADLPSADVRENVKGEWISLGDFVQCSNCTVTIPKEFDGYYGKVHREVRSNFCPYCGSDNRGITNGNLGEYRQLVQKCATAEQRIKQADEDKYARNTENEALKKENAELKAQLYELTKPKGEEGEE